MTEHSIERVNRALGGTEKEQIPNEEKKHKEKKPIIVKKYANRRLYNTATSSYVTLHNLLQMVREGIEFQVLDIKTGEDITRLVLTQIIVEEEGKGGQNLLPIGFLRQLISFYGDGMQSLVPRYLESSLRAFVRNQEQVHQYFQEGFGSLFGVDQFGKIGQQIGLQNMSLVEQAFRNLFSLSASASTPFSQGVPMKENGTGSSAASASWEGRGERDRKATERKDGTETDSAPSLYMPFAQPFAYSVEQVKQQLDNIQRILEFLSRKEENRKAELDRDVKESECRNSTGTGNGTAVEDN